VEFFVPASRFGVAVLLRVGRSHHRALVVGEVSTQDRSPQQQSDSSSPAVFACAPSGALGTAGNLPVTRAGDLRKTPNGIDWSFTQRELAKTAGISASEPAYDTFRHALDRNCAI
jgi:hypothetical protein